MIKKIFFLISLLTLIINCSGFEFVYNTSFETMNKINKNTLVSISGDNKDIINRYSIPKNSSLKIEVFALSTMNNGKFFF